MNLSWILNILPEYKTNSLFNHCKDAPPIFSYFNSQKWWNIKVEVLSYLWSICMLSVRLANFKVNEHRNEIS
jgi:hypothetical protein